MEPICLSLHIIKNNDIILYKVNDYINDMLFYLKIDISKNLLAFYKDETCNNPMGKIDLTTKQLSPISGIKSNVILMLSAKIITKIKEGNFPEQINIISH